MKKLLINGGSIKPVRIPGLVKTVFKKPGKRKNLIITSNFTFKDQVKANIAH